MSAKNRQELLDEIAAYHPFNEQEERDKNLIFQWIEQHEDAFSRENTVAHVTASAWMVNKDRSKVLMVYHNIYNSWSWLGGHADGETDLLSVAIREGRGWYSTCTAGIGEYFFSGIFNGGGTCKEGKVYIQPLASEYYLPIGSGFRGRCSDKGR